MQAEQIVDVHISDDVPELFDAGCEEIHVDSSEICVTEQIPVVPVAQLLEPPVVEARCPQQLGAAAKYWAQEQTNSGRDQDQDNGDKLTGVSC